MKQILVFTITKINPPFDNGIYTSLYKKIAKRNKVDIISFGLKEETHQISDNIRLFILKNGDYFKVNNIKKAINQLMLSRKIIKKIKKDLKLCDYDLLLYSTPPITMNKAISYVKKQFKLKTYLLLKDIFPQNAVDLKMFRKNGMIYRYFRKKEKVLYSLSDFIGVMSKENKTYLLNNNNINENKIEINPNSIEILENDFNNKIDRIPIFTKYNIPLNKTIFIYGGNLGEPQGIDYLLDVVKKNEGSSNHIIIVGDGTQKNKIINFLNGYSIKDTTFIEKLPKNEYNLLLKLSDAGLIFLDNRFTIPNIPSRLLSYLEYRKPVIAATDVNTDLKDIIEDGNFGYWCESKNPKDMIDLFERIKQDDLIEKLGINGRKYLEKNYDVKITANLILDKLKEG